MNYCTLSFRDNSNDVFPFYRERRARARPITIQCMIFLISHSDRGSSADFVSSFCIFFTVTARRKIRLIEGNSKYRHLKILNLKGILRQLLSVWGAELHNPPPPLTHCSVYVYAVYLFTQGKGGGVGRWTREKVRGKTDHKAGSKIPTWLTVSLV